jgi:hypothetical protein
MWIEAMAFFRSIRSFDPIAIELTRANAPQPDVPDITGAMTHRI